MGSMGRRATLCGCLFAAACATRSEPAKTADIGVSTLPPDVAALVERMDQCAHFAGEFGGDGSERDRQVAAAIARLRCDALDGEVGAARRRHADAPGVVRALDRATAP